MVRYITTTMDIATETGSCSLMRDAPSRRTAHLLAILFICACGIGGMFVWHEAKQIPTPQRLDLAEKNDVPSVRN